MIARGGDESEEGMDEAKQDLSELNHILKSNDGTVPAAKILEQIKKRINSMSCQNQGYVLDGFPSKLAEAKELFKCIF